MKKLYYRCSDMVDETLKAEAERQHMTKNQLMDNIIRKHFDIPKTARSYRKYNKTEERMLAEIVAIGADVMDMRDTLEDVRARRIYDEKLRNICMDSERNLIRIEQKLKLIESQIKMMAIKNT